MSGLIATINRQVNGGFAQAAIALGQIYTQFRPAQSATVAALDPGNQLATLQAWLTTDPGLSGKNPPVPGKPLWYGAFDTTETLPGDYLVGPIGVFFLATQLLPQPPSLVFCNETVSLTQLAREVPGPSATRGASGTSPNGAATAPYALAFPCSLIPGERRSTAELHLPGETQLPSATLLLPLSIPGGKIARGDVALTQGGTAWTVQSASKDLNCWTVIAASAGA